MIKLANIKKQFGTKILFDDASAFIKPNERIGLIGPNGAGKTTLLNIIAGKETIDEGEILMQKNLSIGYLQQDISETTRHSLLEEVLSGFPQVSKLEQKLLQLEAELAARPDDEALLHKYGRMQERFETAGGYELEAQAKAILTGIGFHPNQMATPASQFSGGWIMRIALAKLLLQKPEILLMDEPTNHLDLNSVIWLEKFLLEYEGTIILISHDQYFQNRVVNRILEIGFKTVKSYTGNYDAYVKAKQVDQEQLESQYRNQQKKVKETEKFIERFRYKASKARQVQSRIKQLEKVERITLEEDESSRIKLRLPEPKRSGNIVAEITDVRKAYGDNIVYNNLNLTILRGQKIALAGVNGAGKSTLLKMLAGRENVQAGSIKSGHNVQNYYYAQHQLEILQPENTILEELALAAPEESEQWVRSLAGRFLFTKDDVFKKITVLSGGEKARVALAKMLAKPANLLILDEPTNHLDMQARDIVTEALVAFPGTIIFISHDRHFINAVASEIMEIENGMLRAYNGNYEYYQWKKANESNPSQPETDSVAAQKKTAATPARSGNRKEDRRARAQKMQALKQRLKPLEAKCRKAENEIASLEKMKKSITEELCRPDVLEDKALLTEKSKSLKDVERKLEKYYEQWSAASEKLEIEKTKIHEDT